MRKKCLSIEKKCAQLAREHFNSRLLRVGHFWFALPPPSMWECCCCVTFGSILHCTVLHRKGEMCIFRQREPDICPGETFHRCLREVWREGPIIVSLTIALRGLMSVAGACIRSISKWTMERLCPKRG